MSYEIERVRAWRFRKVSEYMRKLDKGALFSAKACKERYCAIMEGTARIPTEIDDDPDARRAEMEAYRTERERVREQESAIKDAKEAKEHKVKEEAKARQAQKAEEIAMKRAEKEQLKAARAMQRAAKQQMRAKRAVELREARIEENADYKAAKAAKEQEEARKKREVNPNQTPGLNRVASLRNVNAYTPDPRSNLSTEDLQKLCRELGIHIVTIKMHGTFPATKDELVQRLRAYDDLLSLNELKSISRAKGLNTTGTKMQMKYQLALMAAKACQSFQQVSNGASSAGSSDNRSGSANGDIDKAQKDVGYTVRKTGPLGFGPGTESSETG